jgi:hypothetical protein
MPKPMGKTVTTVTYKDANLYHDMLTGRSVTGILHLCNQTLIDWFSKQQATVETATFGSEFTAARIAVDQVIDLRTTLRYLGVPVKAKSFMFGDNQAVVTNSSIPHSSLNKRHNALAYHRVREMIALKVLGYYWIDGKDNPADIVSKHWSYPQVWHLLKAILGLITTFHVEGGESRSPMLFESVRNTTTRKLGGNRKSTLDSL